MGVAQIGYLTEYGVIYQLCFKNFSFELYHYSEDFYMAIFALIYIRN